MGKQRRQSRSGLLETQPRVCVYTVCTHSPYIFFTQACLHERKEQGRYKHRLKQGFLVHKEKPLRRKHSGVTFAVSSLPFLMCVPVPQPLLQITLKLQICKWPGGGTCSHFLLLEIQNYKLIYRKQLLERFRSGVGKSPHISLLVARRKKGRGRKQEKSGLLLCYSCHTVLIVFILASQQG